MLSWAQHLAPLIASSTCLEATGSYGEGVAMALVEQEQHVSVVIPPASTHFGWLWYRQQDR